MKEKKGLIFACDLQEKEKALEVTKEVSDYIDAVKVNYPLILSTGIKFISDLSEYAPVISDFKVADVPHVNKIICKKTFENNSYGVICHSFVGKKSLEACKEIADDFNSKLFSVVEMSHPGAQRFIHPISKELCKLSKEVGVDGVVAPGNDINRLRDVRRLIGDKLNILSPGIGLQGGKTRKAIEAGADYVIVGRKIYESKNPRKTTRKLKMKIENERS